MKGVLSLIYAIYWFEVFLQSPRQSRAVPTMKASAPGLSEVFRLLWVVGTTCIRARGQNASLFIVSEHQ